MSKEVKNLRELYEKIKSIDSKIFIVGHKEPDFDSIASALGMQTLCTQLGKESYVIIDEPDIILEPGVKRIKDINRFQHKIITLSEYDLLKEKDSTLIVVDTNKKDLIYLGDSLEDFKGIFVIDHHQMSSDSLERINYFIDSNISSASEIVSQLLIGNKIKCESNIYTYLLAGIILDTSRFKKNTTSHTHDVAKKLINKGADREYISELFLTDFNDDKKINDLVFNGTEFESYIHSLLQTYNISFTMNRNNPTEIYRRDQIAKAADRMLKYRIDAAFVLGYTDDKNIQVSARSKGIVDVGKIMAHIGGGGNRQNAAAKIDSLSIEALESTLKVCLSHGFELYALPQQASEEKNNIVFQKKKVM